MTFEQLGVREDLLRAITEMGFESPMPVQEKVIPHLLHSEGDVVALAQTGTGKTAAFGLPVIQRIDTTQCRPQALILSPTRELCLQISDDLADFSKYVDRLKVLPVYGGSSIESQIRALRGGVHIVVATPGRLLDLINRGTVDLAGVHTVVLDEADEMLNMGFVDDINSILSCVPEERKMLLFSATMPNEIARIAKQYMHNPEEFVVGTRNEGAENVRHIYYMVNARDKYLALKRIADSNPGIYAIIFCRTRRETQEIASDLIVDGYNVDSLHGDLSQQQRDTVMKKFREHTLQLLVATDVAARGLDVDNLTHVINYGLPDDLATYTHRSGRTGRAGKNGVSISIVHSREKSKIRAIEKQIGKTFEHKLVPTPQYIIEKQLYNLASRIEKVEVNEAEIANYLPGILRKLEWLSGEDLLKRIISMEFNRLIEYYRDAPVVEDYQERKPKRAAEPSNARSSRGRKSDAQKDSRTAEHGYERVYVNAGKSEGFMPARLIEIINDNMPTRVDIGRIDLLKDYTLFDVRRGFGAKVAKALTGARFFGHRLYAELADANRDYAKVSVRRTTASKSHRDSEEERFTGPKNKRKSKKNRR